MSSVTVKAEIKNIIDTLNEDQSKKILGYARLLDCENTKYNLQNLKKYRGKIDFNIDLNVLRGRNVFN